MERHLPVGLPVLKSSRALAMATSATTQSPSCRALPPMAVALAQRTLPPHDAPACPRIQTQKVHERRHPQRHEPLSRLRLGSARRPAAGLWAVSRRQRRRSLVDALRGGMTSPAQVVLHARWASTGRRRGGSATGGTLICLGSNLANTAWKQVSVLDTKTALGSPFRRTVGR